MRLKKNLYLSLYLLFALSCAKQTSPTGGPKDTIPPVLVNSIPAREAINYKGNSLELEFSEMIITNNPKEQLIITPSIGKDFEVKTRKNSVIVNFESELIDSTTYTFNFRDAVQDATEKNPVRNLQIAFSTGPYIDSLSIQGKIFDLIKGKELKDATVAIHIPNDTFSILKHPATLFTKTDDKGNFKIDHLKPGSYYLYAFEDKNRNLVADSRNESYGFLSQPIILKKDTSSILVGLTRLDTRPLKITSTRPYNTYYNIRTTKNSKTFTVTATDRSTLFYSFGEDPSNVRIYNNGILQGDSIAVKFNATDSIANVIDTTLYAKFATREVTPEKFNANLSATSIIADKGLLSATVTFSKPVKTFNYDSIYFRVDSLTTILILPTDLTWVKQHNRLTIKKKLDKKLFEPKPAPPVVKPDLQPADTTGKPSTPAQSIKTPKKEITNQLYIGTAAFISIDNDSSKRITETITPLKPEDLSKIIYDIGIAHKNFLVQLLDKNLNLVQQIEDKPKAEFTDLTAGEYLLRVVIDNNNNSIWDPGNYFIKEEPEKIIYYKDEKESNRINLKANWDFELAPMLISD
jgi:uncharacterized protein (DUF2141 family)